MQQNNKGRRQELTQLKYIKRIKRFVSNLDYYFTRTGEQIYKPTTKDVTDDNGQFVYKSTSTPCSCWGCAYLKYHRHEQKIIDRKIIQEGLDEYNERQFGE